MALPAIRVEGLGKQYRLVHGQKRAPYRTLRDSIMNIVTASLWKRGTIEEFWALKDVSFEVKPGEVVGIIGRNGAGKSTLLKILSRITKPSTGRVEINGRVGSLLEVGTGFHPELTGRENIYLNGSILGMSRKEIDQRFDEIVAFAEVEKFLDMPVKRYSSGMHVRLAFAVAAHLEPEILIVDEVLAVGDQAFQQKCLGKMSSLASSGRTIFFVSHQMGAVQALCSHAVLLESGMIRCTGGKNRVIAEYLESISQKSVVGDWIEFDVDQRSFGLRARFVGLRIGSGIIEAANHLFPDGPAEFDIRVVSHEQIKPVYIALSLYDRFGTCLIRTDTVRCPVMSQVLPGENQFRLQIESLHLNPGTYRVDLWIADGDEVLDSLQHAANVTVTEFSFSPEIQTAGEKGLVTNRFSFTRAGVELENPIRP